MIVVIQHPNLSPLNTLDLHIIINVMHFTAFSYGFVYSGNLHLFCWYARCTVTRKTQTATNKLQCVRSPPRAVLVSALALRATTNKSHHSPTMYTDKKASEQGMYITITYNCTNERNLLQWWLMATTRKPSLGPPLKEMSEIAGVTWKCYLRPASLCFSTRTTYVSMA